LYLRRKNFERLKHLVDRIEVVTAELGDWLDAEKPSSVSKCNLSDIFEYLSEAETALLFEKLIGATGGGARICYWNLLVVRSAPAALRRYVRPHEAEASALGREDRSWFYRAFHIDEVTRS
jgi:S-adenosylmethionine-diacylglycerol 3-amino-3-carboxypropyl transferase